MASMRFRRDSSTCRIFGNLASGPTFGSMPTTCSSGPILRIWLQLIAKILQREFAARSLRSSSRGLFLVDGLLGALDQREHVAHAEDARDDALGIETLRARRIFRRCRRILRARR